MITKITLTVAIVLGLAVTAGSAATKHRRPAPANPPVYNAAGSRAVPSGVSLLSAVPIALPDATGFVVTVLRYCSVPLVREP